MNAQITKLFGVVVVLFALLLVWTTRWTVIDSKALRNNPLNDRTLVQELRIKRGRILADNGEVLARSVRQGGGTWARTYPTGSLFAQVVGYSLPRTGQSAGLEASRGEELRGVQTGLSSIFGPFNSNRVGDDVYTSLDPKAQQVALQGLAGRAGSVVALDPRTGEVKVMISLPTYNDNTPNATGANVSQFNAATQANTLPPGSTFKVVTASAGVDSGKYTPNSTINGKSPITVSGVPLANDNNEQFGFISLSDALTFSVNTVFAQVAEALGRVTMTDYMKRFGFYSRPPLDLPANEIAPSRVYSVIDGRPLPPGSPNEDIGRIGIGQGGLGATPLQMALVAAAVANGGKLMKPHFTTKVVNSDGQTVETINPSVWHTVLSSSAAAAVTQMMRRVVEEGTGQPAQLGNDVAGKTGTASIGATGSGLTEPWFIGFAPINHPRVAVAVTVDRTQGGYGATVAAPIAKLVIDTLLAEGG